MTILRSGIAVLAMASLPLAGCTTLKVNPATSDPASRQGIAYFLPFSQFETKVTWAASCDETTKELSLTPKIEATAKNGPDPAALYVIDYASLSAFTKTSSVKVTFYDSGAIKSINAEADDRTAEILTKTISAVGKVAKLVVTAGADKALCSADLVQKLSDADKAKKEVDRLTALLAKHTRDLDASSARVTRAGAAISRSLRQSHDTAISNVVATQIDLDSAKGLLEERTKAVSHTSTVVFPEASSVIASTKGIQIPAATLAKWVARKVNAAGKPLETDDQFKTRVEGLAAQAATWLELKSTTALVDPAKARAVAASGKPGDTGLKDASDPGPEAGVRYRVGVPAVLRACKGGPCTKVGVEEGELFKTLPVTLLNRDTTFFLPFHSKAFTNGALSATFAESGVLTSAGYEQKKAAGEAVAGLLDALAAEVSTVVEADRANSKSKLEKLEEEIKLAKAEKDLADAKAALDESGNDANEDAIAALAADTALKQAQVANINADIAVREAQAKLAEAGPGN